MDKGPDPLSLLSEAAWAMGDLASLGRTATGDCRGGGVAKEARMGEAPAAAAAAREAASGGQDHGSSEALGGSGRQGHGRLLSSPLCSPLTGIDSPVRRAAG